LRYVWWDDGCRKGEERIAMGKRDLDRADWRNAGKGECDDGEKRWGVGSPTWWEEVW